MTIADMVSLVEMWINLSSTQEGQIVEKIVLPGNLTGRSEDRVFACRPMISTPKFDPSRLSWEDHLHNITEYIDFVEVTKDEFSAQ